MIILIGLGNPGEKYEDTWHNIGFMAADHLQEKKNFPQFSLSKKFNSLISEMDIDGEKILIMKPQTFMNESGRAIGKAKEYYKNSVKQIIIFHDDIDILAGKIKISKERGSAGHRGVQSIFDNIGEENIIRIRIGIAIKDKKELDTKNFVLKKIGRTNSQLAKKAIKKSCEALEDIMSLGVDSAMTRHNQ